MTTPPDSPETYPRRDGEIENGMSGDAGSSAVPTRRHRKTWVPLVVILAVTALLATAAIGGLGGSAQQQAAPAVGQPEQPGQPAGENAEGDGPAAEVAEPEEQPRLDMARRDPADPLSAGPVDAPVTMVVYSDYQCPFCAVWSEQTLPTMLEYVDRGDLRIEWRDVNVFGPDSARAARAAYAAGLQGSFWEYHHELFAEGEKRSPAELTDEALIATASDLGLDVDTFTRDFASAEVGEAVQRNADEGASVGAFSTPAFLVGGIPVVGAQPTDVFVQTVEQALVEAQG